MNRNIASALFVVAAAVAGQAYADPDYNINAAPAAASSKSRADVQSEARQVKQSGFLIGADTQPMSDNFRSTKNRSDIRAEVLAGHQPSGVVRTPQ